MGCGELAPINATLGGQGSQWDGHVWLGKMVGDFGYVLTMPWGSSIYSSSDRNALWREIDIGLAPWLEEEDDEAWGHLLQLW